MYVLSVSDISNTGEYALPRQRQLLRNPHEMLDTGKNTTLKVKSEESLSLFTLHSHVTVDFPGGIAFLRPSECVEGGQF